VPEHRDIDDGDALHRPQAQEIAVGGDESLRLPGDGTLQELVVVWVSTQRIRREGVTSVTRRRSRAIRARDSSTVIWSFRSTSGRRRTASTSARMGSDASRVNRPSSHAS
jgi:hypothetical protein